MIKVAPVWQNKLSHVALLLCLCAVIAGCRTSLSPSRRDAFDPVLFAQAATSRLALTNAGSRQWRVRADVDGHTGLFAIDTGSANTVLSPQFADKLPITPIGKMTVRSREKNSVDYIDINYLTLGAIAYLDFYAPIVNLDHLNAALPSPIDGILGMNILGKTRCTIDWKNNLLVLDTNSYSPPTNATSVTLRDHRLYVTAQANGHPIQLALDTGAYRTCLAKSELRHLAIPASKRTSVHEDRIDIIESRDVEQTQVQLDTFQLAPINQSNYEVLIWNHNVLGMDLLEQYLLTFDTRNHWLTLTQSLSR